MQIAEFFYVLALVAHVAVIITRLPERFRGMRTFRDADQAETWLVLQQSLADQQQAQA
jgi:hypothetical protein